MEISFFRRDSPAGTYQVGMIHDVRADGGVNPVLDGAQTWGNDEDPRKNPSTPYGLVLIPGVPLGQFDNYKEYEFHPTLLDEDRGEYRPNRAAVSLLIESQPTPAERATARLEFQQAYQIFINNAIGANGSVRVRGRDIPLTAVRVQRRKVVARRRWRITLSALPIPVQAKVASVGVITIGVDISWPDLRSAIRDETGTAETRAL